MNKISHLNDKGEAHMVNVGEKKISKRCAIAEGYLKVNEATIEKIKKIIYQKEIFLVLPDLQVLWQQKRLQN